MSDAPGIVRRLRSAAGPLAKTGMLTLGGYSVLRRLAPSRRIAILRYHAVCGEEGYAYADPGICVSPAAFEAHVRYLAKHYTVLPLPEVADYLSRRRSLPRNTVSITFDDGYADNLAAARVLHRYGVSGTFYITSDCLQGGEPFWPSEVRVLVAALPGPILRLEPPGGRIEIRVDTAAERQAAIRTINRLYKSHSIPVREALRAQLRRAAGDPHVPNFMLAWAELAEMHRMGMTIGAHTRTHPNLPNAGIEAATSEMVGSKLRLESELGAPVTMFSYPNGGAERYYTADLQKEVAKHFAAAASSRNGFAGPGSDLYALERVEVEERLEDLVFALEVERFAFGPARS
jgi:peptidoglycan/xylan/chitin deacetylase (PgdA/CDA1 family)